jgi:hypothetical protein
MKNKKLLFTGMPILFVWIWLIECTNTKVFA